MSDPAIKQELIDSILDEMRKWTSYQATVIYENETKLQEFIHLMVKKYFEENSDIGFNNNLQEQNINIEESINDIFNFKNSPYFSTASNDNNLYITNFSGEKLEAAKFEFDQGFDQIGGVHRAFFLEKIHELQSSNTSPLTTTSSFPIKIPYSSGSYIYELYLDNLYLTPTTTKIDAYLIVKSNTSDQKIVLQAEDVIITSSGIQSATLKLKSNVDVKLNNVTLLKLKKNVTEVTWTCSGFDSFKIGADVEFCNLYVTPLDAALEPESGSLVVSITGEGSDWMEFYVDMTANKSFALTKYPEYKFTIPKIVFDFDSQNNATSFPVVVGYDSNHLDPLGRLANSWKGVYINQLNVQIPDQITGSSIVGNIFFDHVLIDGRGFSGSMSYKKEILSLEDGSKGGWGFSIDKLGIVILHQHMAGFSMGGQVEMPLFKGEFDYIASLTTENEYQMTIQNRTDVEMPLLIADATLDDFRATANYDGSDFQFTVHASGILELKQSDLTSKLKNMPKLKFSEVIIQNYGKKLDAGDWSIVGGPNSDSKINFLGMELGFKTVKGSKAIKIEERENDETAIPLSVSATFLESIGLEISGEVSIIGYYDDVTDPKLHKWRFKKIGIDGVGACITSIPGAEEARICVTLTEDANGNPVFRGDGTATFGRDKLKIKASVVGEFGWNGDDKYFFVDGLAELDPGLIVPPILFKGFGGGLSYNMQFDFDPASIDWTANLSDPPTELGSTFSGGTYTFNNSVGLGFSAMTLFEMAGSAGLLNGSLLLNFNFHGGNGFTMKIIGLAQMMANFDVNNIPVLGNVANELDGLGDNRLTSWLSEQDEKPPGIPLGGYIYLEVVNGALTGKLKVFLDAYGILEGRQNYEVVDADLYFAGFNDWFINIGKPSKAAGMKFNAAGVLKADVFGYFNAGTNLPDYSYEYLPSKIRNFVRNNVKISDALRNSGAGIMFGLGFEIGANVSIGIASAEASAGAGFDIMIRKYKDASCLGSTGELGIDGWYAMGQVWAFVEGSLRVFGLEVINAGLYAVMNAQLPNPTFVQAAMKIKFKFLFKRFTKTMRITMGEQCIIESNDPNDIVGIDVITMIDPFRGTESLPVNTSANVFYALPLNKKIEETNVSFEVKNEQVKLYNSQGFQLDYQLERNIEGNETKIIPTVMLPENDSITIIVSVDVYKDNIFVVTQSDTSYFYTSERFLDIPLSNIEYSYPLDDMYNLYPYEGAITSSEPIGPLSGIDGTFGAPGATVVEGFIKLKQGQPDILLNIEEGYSQLVKFTDQNGDYFLVPAQYDAYNTQIDYLLPSDLLISESIYKLDFGLFKDGVWDADVAIPDNTIATINEFLSDDQGNTGQSNSLPDELILASLHFRVSSFGTFIEKIDDIKLNGTFSTPTNSSVPTINSIPIQSSIDYVEIFGNSVYDDALIRIKSSSNYNPDMYHSLFSRPYEVYKSEIISRTSACNDLETFFESQKEEELWKSKLIGLNTNSLHKLSGANEQASSNIQVIKYTYDKYASDTYERATAKISQCGSPYLEKLARDLAKKAINTQSPDADCCSQNISLASRNLDELTWCNIDNEECVWEKGMDLYLHQGLINWHLNGAGPTKPPSSSEFHLSLSYHIPGGKKTSTAVIWFNN